MEGVMWVRVSKRGHVCSGNGLWEKVGYMGTSGKRDGQFVFRILLNDFNDDALTISADSSFQNGTARMLKAYWRRWV